MPVSISLSVYNIELLGLTCNIGYKGGFVPSLLLWAINEYITAPDGDM